MTTRKILAACLLMLAVTLTGCAYTSTTDADQESMGFDATAIHADCKIAENCPHNPADCPMSEESCKSMQKSECPMDAAKAAECAEKKAECESEAAKPCCEGEASSEG